LLWFFTALATLPLSVRSRHAKSWVTAALSDCKTSPGELDLQPPTGVDVCFVVYVVVANFVAPLVLMTFFYSRIYRTIRLHKMSVILRDVLITEVDGRTQNDNHPDTAKRSTAARQAAQFRSRSCSSLRWYSVVPSASWSP